MSVIAAIPLFLASLAVTLVAAQLFARRLDRLGVRFALPEALIGLLTALAADGPEISSALFALAKGAHSVSIGVLVGSNAFNLAAMIGVSGLLAGSVLLPRESLLLEGLVGAAITLMAAAVLLHWLSAAVAAILAACIVIPYLVVVIGGSEVLAHRRGIKRATGLLRRALAEQPRQARTTPTSQDPTHHLVGLAVLDVVLIVAGSGGMVQAALALGDHWHIARAVLGTLVLAPLTSMPNAITGVRLGLARRGAALVGETFNSNTINLGGGVIVPALFTSFATLSTTADIQLAWLLAMTFGCLALLARPRGIRRPDAIALILLYVGFALIQAFSS